MNTIAYKFFMLAMVLMMSVAGYSHDAFINGVYYNLDNSTKKATVTYKGDMLTRGLSPCANNIHQRWMMSHSSLASILR